MKKTERLKNTQFNYICYTPRRKSKEDKKEVKELEGEGKNKEKEMYAVY